MEAQWDADVRDSHSSEKHALDNAGEPAGKQGSRGKCKALQTQLRAARGAVARPSERAARRAQCSPTRRHEKKAERACYVDEHLRAGFLDIEGRRYRAEARAVCGRHGGAGRDTAPRGVRRAQGRAQHQRQQDSTRRAARATVDPRGHGGDSERAAGGAAWLAKKSPAESFRRLPTAATRTPRSLTRQAAAPASAHANGGQPTARGGAERVGREPRAAGFLTPSELVRKGWVPPHPLGWVTGFGSSGHPRGTAGWVGGGAAAVLRGEAAPSFCAALPPTPPSCAKSLIRALSARGRRNIAVCAR